MKYKEFLGLWKFITKLKKSSDLLVRFQSMSLVNKYYRRPYFKLLKLYNILIFFKIYKLKAFKNFNHFWKYIRYNTINKLVYFLKVYRHYTIFFFSYRVRNLFCIIWQGNNIETFFSSYLCSDRRSRANFLPQLKIIRYLTYIYFKSVASNVKLQFTEFSVKIRYIIKLFFFWLSFYIKLSVVRKTFFLRYVLINNKFPRGRLKKKMYPTKKRYLQRRSSSRVVFS